MAISESPRSDAPTRNGRAPIETVMRDDGATNGRSGDTPRPTVAVGLGVGRMDEATRERDLRRMKRLATGLLLVATVIFLLARWWEVNDGPVWIGYLRAMAEAGMVGALADWFAVTALFRRPLGLPIPHTAIIPTKKDVLGDSLGDFVGENFLSEHVVRDKLRRVEVSSRLGGWLSQPANADRVTAELATAARGVVTVLRDEDVQEVIEQVLVRKLMERPIGPPLGAVLQGVLADGAHHRLVDLVCDRAYDWVVDNRDRLMRHRHRAGAELVAPVRRRHDRRPGVHRGAELRVGGQDRPGAPAALGDRHLPRASSPPTCRTTRTPSSGPSGSSTRS